MKSKEYKKKERKRKILQNKMQTSNGISYKLYWRSSFRFKAMEGGKNRSWVQPNPPKKLQKHKHVLS